ncbi:hypothetical protein D3C85_1812170 [compost metagenome]
MDDGIPAPIPDGVRRKLSILQNLPIVPLTICVALVVTEPMYIRVVLSDNQTSDRVIEANSLAMVT